MTPVRIQRSRKHKQVSPNGLPIVYVGRPFKWGNPFKLKGGGLHTIEQVLSAYETVTKEKIKQGMLNIEELRGKNLSCWCPLSQKCHSEILLKLANQ